MPTCLKIIKIAAFILLTLASCSQARLLTQVHAFEIIQVPGNIEIDDPSSQVSKIDTVNFIFYESNQKIDWRVAWKNGKCYNITTTLFKEKKIEVGTSLIDQKKITLTATGNNSLWHLLLQPQQACALNNEVDNDGLIYLDGYLNGKKINQKIDKIIRLSTPPAK